MHDPFFARAVLAGLLPLIAISLGCDDRPRSPSAPSTTPAAPAVAAVPERPSIAAVSPGIGSTRGGTFLTITGTGFRPGATVTLGGVSLGVYAHSNHTTLFGITRAHPAGTANVMVTNPDGEADTLIGGYAFAPPQSFDFNGNWDGWADAEEHYRFQFVVQNNLLISASCGTSGIVTFPVPAPVNDGEFSYSHEGVAVAGTIVSPSAARGTITMGPCAGIDWSATRE